MRYELQSVSIPHSLKVGAVMGAGYAILAFAGWLILDVDLPFLGTEDLVRWEHHPMESLGLALLQPILLAISLGLMALVFNLGAHVFGGLVVELEATPPGASLPSQVTPSSVSRRSEPLTWAYETDDGEFSGGHTLEQMGEAIREATITAETRVRHGDKAGRADTFADLDGYFFGRQD